MNECRFTLDLSKCYLRVRDLVPVNSVYNKYGFDFTNNGLYCFYNGSFQMSVQSMNLDKSLEISFDEFEILLSNQFKKSNLIFY